MSVVKGGEEANQAPQIQRHMTGGNVGKPTGSGAREDGNDENRLWC